MFNNKICDKVFLRAIDDDAVFGIELPTLIKDFLIEEMAELTIELQHHNRGKDNQDKIMEEIADCFYMLYHITHTLALDTHTIEEIIIEKIRRSTEKVERFGKDAFKRR